jgi:hypothetical protein
MRTTVDLHETLFRVMFRVLGRRNGIEFLLFSSEIYESSEQFCWRYDGHAEELVIEKVWIRKEARA